MQGRVKLGGLVTFGVVAAAVSTGIGPSGVGPTSASAQANVVIPAPAIEREAAIAGFIDTHIHQQSYMAFGGLAMWGSTFDPLYPASGSHLTMADFENNTPAAEAARARALPSSEYLFVDGTGHSRDHVERLTMVQQRSEGSCHLTQLEPWMNPSAVLDEAAFYTRQAPFPTVVNGQPRGLCITGPNIRADGTGSRVRVYTSSPDSRCPMGSGTTANPCYRFTIHGSLGADDAFNAMAFGGSRFHGVSGYPSMGALDSVTGDTVGWPAWDVLTMQSAYWEWLKRAHEHGLQLIVMLANNSEFFCAEAVRRTDFGCLDDAALERQMDSAKLLEQYIDELSGPEPDNGFYQIVYSAEEARQEIARGNLAVVLGSETDHQWGCKVNVNGVAAAGCTPSQVVRGLDHWQNDLGIRVVYPVHRLNNAFGGAAIYNQLFDAENMAINDDEDPRDGGPTLPEWFEMTDACESGIEWRSEFREQYFILRLVLLAAAALPFPLFIQLMTNLGLLGLAAGLGDFQQIPASINGLNSTDLVYRLAWTIPPAPGFASYLPDPSPNCNAMPLMPLGQSLVEQLMDRRMIIDVDHMDNRVFEQVLDLAEVRCMALAGCAPDGRFRGYAGIESGHTGLHGSGYSRAEYESWVRVDGQRVFFSDGDVFSNTTHTEYNKSDEQVRRIIDLGGSLSLVFNSGTRQRIADRVPNDGISFRCGNSSEAWLQVYLYATERLGLDAVGIGSDMDGWFQTPAPRYGPEACGNQAPQFAADPDRKVGDRPPAYDARYNPAAPFEGQIDYDDEDYLFPMADGTLDLRTLDTQVFGLREWDYNVHGFSNVGSYADFVADLQEIGMTEEGLAPLFNAAENYLDMWERIEDVEPPTVACGDPGDTEYTANVTVECVAWDHGAGLQDEGRDAFFTLSTNEQPGVTTDSAATTGYVDAGGNPIDICDRNGNCVQRGPITGIRLAVAIDAVPAITSPGAATVTIGTSSSFTIRTTAPSDCATSVAGCPQIDLVGTLPDGLTLQAGPTDGTATICCTPAPGTAGEHLLTVTATFPAYDDVPQSVVVQSFAVTVLEAPSLGPIPPLEFGLGAPGSITIPVRGFPQPVVTVTGELPAGISFDAATSQLSGVALGDNGGRYPVTFVARNGVGADAVAPAEIVVSPAITQPASAVFTVGQHGTAAISTVAATAMAASDLPPGLTLVERGGAFAIEGTPPDGSGGVYDAVLSASDGTGGMAQRSVRITVLEVPVIGDLVPAHAVVGVAQSIPLSATGYPSPAMALSGELPDGLSFDLVAGQPGRAEISGTPAPGTAGTYQFDVVAANVAASVDGSTPGEVRRTFTLTVLDPGDLETSIRLDPPVPNGRNDWYTVPVTVTVAAAGPVAETRCALDPPVPASTFDDLPAGPCQVDVVGERGVHTVYAASSDAVGNTSVVTVRTFAVDQTTPPADTVVVDPPAPNGSGGWYTVPVGITITNPEAIETRCALNPPPPAPAGFSDLAAEECAFGPTQTSMRLSASGGPLSDGVNTIYSASANAAGTAGPIGSTVVKLDQTPPSLTASVTGATVGSVASVTVDAHDAASGLASAECARPDTSSAGLQQLRCTAVDIAGNTTVTVIAYTVLPAGSASPEVPSVPGAPVGSPDAAPEIPVVAPHEGLPSTGGDARPIVTAAVVLLLGGVALLTMRRPRRHRQAVRR